MRHMLAAIFLTISASAAFAADCPDGPGSQGCKDLFDYWSKPHTDVNSIVDQTYQDQSTVTPPRRWDPDR